MVEKILYLICQVLYRKKIWTPNALFLKNKLGGIMCTIYTYSINMSFLTLWAIIPTIYGAQPASSTCTLHQSYSTYQTVCILNRMVYVWYTQISFDNYI